MSEWVYIGMIWALAIGIWIAVLKNTRTLKDFVSELERTLSLAEQFKHQRDEARLQINQLKHAIEQYKDAAYEWETVANGHLEKLRAAERTCGDLQDQVAYLTRQVKDANAFTGLATGECDE